MATEHAAPRPRTPRGIFRFLVPAVLLAGIGHEHGPRRIGKRSHATHRPSYSRGQIRHHAEQARIAAQIEKRMLQAEPPKQTAAWLERRLAIAEHRKAMAPGIIHPKGGHTTKSARRRRALEAGAAHV